MMGSRISLRKHYGLWLAPVLAVLTLIVAAVIQRATGVFFFSTIISTTSVAIVALFAMGFGFKNRERPIDSWLQAGSVALIGALLAFSFLSTVPLNVDRSFSVWSLNQIFKQDRESKGIPVVELKTALEEYFASNSGEIDRRLSEQVSVGNIVISNDHRISLTKQGVFQRNLFYTISLVFGLNPKYAR